jgi:DNA-binding response OmpR family regulator
MNRILLVEDEAHVVSFITKGLSEDGYEVSVALDGQTGLSMADQNGFDLIILDIMLPEMNGLEVCKAIRKKNTKVPILFLTALGTSENVVIGLEAGADDYLVKPFKFIELVARIKTLLRRTGNNDQEHLHPEEQEAIYTIDDLVLNDYTKKVTRDGIDIQLTSTDYRLLLKFLQNNNKVLSRMEILEKVWHVDFNMSTNVVDVYVNYLRKKIEGYNQDKLIHTVIGRGYVLKSE